MKTLKDVYVLKDSSFHLIDDSQKCAICAQDFEIGNKVLHVPFDGDPTTPLEIAVHLHCAVMTNEIDLGVQFE